MQNEIKRILKHTEFKEPGPGKDELALAPRKHREDQQVAKAAAVEAQRARLEALRQSETVAKLAPLAGRRLEYGTEVVAQMRIMEFFHSDWSNGVRWVAEGTGNEIVTALRLPPFDQVPAVDEFLKLVQQTFGADPSIRDIRLVRDETTGLQKFFSIPFAAKVTSLMSSRKN